MCQWRKLSRGVAIIVWPKGEDVVDSKAEKEGAEFFGRAAYLTVEGQGLLRICGQGSATEFSQRGQRAAGSGKLLLWAG